MNKEIKKKWVEALRSGKYKQTKGFLKSGKGFCCLGVLADVVYDNPWVQDDVAPGVHFLKLKNGYFNDAGVPGRLVDFESQTELITMNDTGGLTFDQIADWIEENL